MASLSRTVLIIGTLAASVSLAQAGDKAAFNAPLRDAMPDIRAIVVETPAATADTTAAAILPVDTKPARSKHAKRLAASRAASRVEAANKRDAVARIETTAPASAAKAAAEAPVSSSARTDAAPAIDQVAQLEAKSADVGSLSAPLTSKATPGVPAQTFAATLVPAGSNTEAA